MKSQVTKRTILTSAAMASVTMLVLSATLPAALSATYATGGDQDKLVFEKCIKAITKTKVVIYGVPWGGKLDMKDGKADGRLTIYLKTFERVCIKIFVDADLVYTIKPVSVTLDGCIKVNVNAKLQVTASGWDYPVSEHIPKGTKICQTILAIDP